MYTRSAGSLAPKCVIEGHSKIIWSLACLRTSLAVSLDETMVLSGSLDGRLWLWNIKKGRMVGDPWEGHNGQVRDSKWIDRRHHTTLELGYWSTNSTTDRDRPREGLPCQILSTSGGKDKIIHVWSKGGEKIESHNSDGHDRTITSFCLSPDEYHLVTASLDYSIRIWDLKTNQLVGNPLLHDDELYTVVVSPDGKYITNAGPDAKVYLWSLEAMMIMWMRAMQSLKQVIYASLGRAARPRDIMHTSLFSQQQPNNRGLAKYDADTNPTPRPATPASQSFDLRWRNALDLHMHHNQYRSNPDIGILAPCRDEDRYGVTPEIDAEAAAAMPRTNNETGSSTQPGQPQAMLGTRVSQGQPTGMQGSSVVVVLPRMGLEAKLNSH
ncbi:WD40 repeat-like protein [Suillus hirtellus]|nr:WD40 repeat-like protein [Suillus hirtellus]